LCERPDLARLFVAVQRHTVGLHCPVCQTAKIVAASIADGIAVCGCQDCGVTFTLDLRASQVSSAAVDAFGREVTLHGGRPSLSDTSGER